MQTKKYASFLFPILIATSIACIASSCMVRKKTPKTNAETTTIKTLEEPPDKIVARQAPPYTTAKLIAAINNGGTVNIPKGIYHLSAPIEILKPTLIKGTTGTVIVPDFGESKAVFIIRSSDVSFSKIHINQKLTKRGFVGYPRALIYNESAATLLNINVIDCIIEGNAAYRFKEVVGVTHGIYLTNALNCAVENCQIFDNSAAGIYLKDLKNFKILNNKVKNTGWYSIHCSAGCDGFDIGSNEITGEKQNIRYWGCSIDLMSQNSPMGAPNKNGTIHHNLITGLHTYGAAIRVMSSLNINLNNNTIRDCYSGDGAPISLIRVGRRGGSGMPNVASQNITIENNTLTAGDAKQLAIMIDNDYVITRDPLTKIYVRKNQISDVSATKFFGGFVVLDGKAAGVADYAITSNTFRYGTSFVPSKRTAITITEKSETGKVTNGTESDNTYTDFAASKNAVEVQNFQKRQITPRIQNELSKKTLPQH